MRAFEDIQISMLRRATHRHLISVSGQLIMRVLSRLSTGFRQLLPVILQAESTECGLACIAMIASFHGLNIDLRVLRQQFSVSLKGAMLSQLIKIAAKLNLTGRAMRAELGELGRLRLPCILHWDFNHFVVLKSLSGKSARIHDPAQGALTISLENLSSHFTGVALELWPSLDFLPKPSSPRLQLWRLAGRVVGLKRVLSQIVMLALVLEMFALLNPLFMQWVIDDVFVSSDRHLLVTLVIGFGLAMLIQQAVGVLRSWCLTHLSAQLSVQWKLNVFNRLLDLPTAFFEKRCVGDIVSRFGSIDSIQQTLTSSFLAAVLDGIVAVITLVMMCVYSMALTGVVFVAAALYALGRMCTYMPLRAASQDTIVKSAKQQSHFLETVRGMKTIQLCQGRQARSRAWISLFVNQINAGLKSQKLQMLYGVTNGVLFGAENLIVMYIGALMVMDGQFSIGMLIAFNSYKGQFGSRVVGLIDNYFAVKLLQVQGERLADIVLEPIDVEPERGVPDPRVLRGRLVMDGVQYRYAQGEPTILNGVDLFIEQGECVAIVGPTGCGKTTLLNLLMGVIKPTRGDVLIDGVGLEVVGVEALRREIGAVLQDDVLFAGSVAENICVFDECPNGDEIVAAAAKAEVHEEISAMPMGYNTLVGDMGSALSGGQKQRVLLARAFYKNPKILILDEATCHLDIGKERQVLACIRALGVTSVVVTHRPEALLSVDRVISLMAGKVVWTGAPVDFLSTHSHELSRVPGKI